MILTVRLDEQSQAHFDKLREAHFPPERNFLKAHLTLFHKLPDSPETAELIADLKHPRFNMQVSKLIHLGAGVAYKLEAPELSSLRNGIKVKFEAALSAQDRKGFRAHITIQNKTSPEQASALMAELSKDFTPFEVKATGLDLWNYLGGPWLHKQFFPFA